jgi:hypothetical protein
VSFRHLSEKVHNLVPFCESCEGSRRKGLRQGGRSCSASWSFCEIALFGGGIFLFFPFFFLEFGGTRGGASW